MSSPIQNIVHAAYDRMSYAELAREYEYKHGHFAPPETMRYRVVVGKMSGWDAVCKPLSKQGPGGGRKRPAVGRQKSSLKCSGFTYMYLHLECAGDGSLPKVRYVGKGQQGQAFSFDRRSADHLEWIKDWFTAGKHQYVQLGLSPAQLEDLSWLNLRSRKHAIISSYPFENAGMEARRLLRLYQLAEQPLFNAL